MARLDAYIELLFREQAQSITLETGSGAILRGSTSSRPVLRQALTTQQIVGALGELVPPDLKDDFPPLAAPVEFRYASPAGEVLVRLEPAGDRVSALISR